MHFSRISVIALLAMATHGAQANGTPTTCPGSALVAEELQRIECSRQQGLTVERYVDQVPSSAYATEFDRRAVTVVHGANAKAVRDVAGISSGIRGMSVGHSHLVKPPLEDQIAHRSMTKATQKHLQWTIWTEQIQYGAQGGAPGYLIDCVTALRSNQHCTTAVAECFPFEERQRFLRTLDAVK